MYKMNDDDDYAEVTILFHDVAVRSLLLLIVLPMER